MSRVEIKMFDSFNICVEGQDVTSILDKSSKSLDILQHLIINRNRFVEMHELVDLFWNGASTVNGNGALKTLISRLRKNLAALSPIFNNCIISRGSRYKFIKNNECVIDVDVFKDLCEKVVNTTKFNENIRKIYIGIMTTYKGQIKSRTSNLEWEKSVNLQFACVYEQIALQFIMCLRKYDEIDNVIYFASVAVEINPYNIPINIVMMEMLFMQGKRSEATKYYSWLINLYDGDNLDFPAEISEMYNSLVSDDIQGAARIREICNELNSLEFSSSPTVCDYATFLTIYQFQRRSLERFEVVQNILLISVYLKSGESNDPIYIDSIMKKLDFILIRTLRKGDTITRYNFAQLLVLLPSADGFDGETINNRILNCFKKMYPYDYEKVGIKLEFSQTGN